MATEAYTPEEAAARFRCKPSWLKTKAEKREIPFTMIGGEYRFTDEHLAWILDHFEEQPRDRTQTGRAPSAPRRKPTEPKPQTGVTELRARTPRRQRTAQQRKAG